MVLVFGKLVTLMGTFPALTAAASVGVNTMAGSFRSLLLAAGPVGIALTAVTIAVSIFHKEIASGIASAWEWVTGISAMRAETNRMGKALDELTAKQIDRAFGLTELDVLARLSGEYGQASQELRQHMRALVDVYVENREQVDSLRDSLIDGNITWEDYRESIIALIPGTKEFIALNKAQAESAANAAVADAALAEEIEKLVAAYESLRRPGDEILDQFHKLGNSTSLTEFVQTYADKILDAVAAHERFGEEIPETLDAMARMAETARDAALGLTANEIVMRNHRAEAALNSGEVKSLTEALDLGREFVKRYREIVQSNREALAAQGLEFANVRLRSEEFDRALAHLGVSGPRSLSAMKDALETVQRTGEATYEELTLAQLKYVTEVIRRTGEIPPEYAGMMEAVAFETDAVLRGPARQAWAEYVAQVKAIGGTLPEEWKLILERINQETEESGFAETVSREISDFDNVKVTRQEGR